MSDSWSVGNKTMARLGEQVDAEITREGGGQMWIFTIEMEDEDGETVIRKVLAGDEDELGQKIADGEFCD